MSYKVIWRDGKLNPADYLSRHATPNSKTPKSEMQEAAELEKTIWFLNFGPFTEAISKDKIISETKKDATLLKLRIAQKKGKVQNEDEDLAPYKKVFHEITMRAYS